jgi:endonuclease/exonuclease/phosphatase family metal-dependent hydrolase
MTPMTAASLNIRGVPLTGSLLTARCQAIGAAFEASDVDVVCFQEVDTYYHLAQLSRRMRSFRYVSFRRILPGPAGGVVTFSRLPVSSTAYQGFGAPPEAPGVPRLTRLRARLKGTVVTRLARPGVSVINTHLLANTDGDWSAANRFCPVHRAQLAALARIIGNVPGPAVVCGDFNIARDSAVFGEFMKHTALADAFEGNCPATFRAEYLPARARPHCIDFILTAGEIKAEAAAVLFAGKQVLRSGAGYVSDHVGLRAELHFPGVSSGLRPDDEELPAEHSPKSLAPQVPPGQPW